MDSLYDRMLYNAPWELEIVFLMVSNACNIPNFGPNTYRHVPIDYDDYLDVYFYIGSKNPLHVNMMICFIWHKPIIDDVCICLFVLGVDPETHD